MSGPARFLSVFIDHNNKCNLKCRMCGFSDERVGALPKYDMPMWLFEKIADQLFPQTSYLALSCLTEPFMTRDFPDRLHLVRRHEVPFSEIITNGTLLNEQNLQKIFDAQITRLVVSIDGGTKETFEAIRVGARFEKVIENLELFKKMKLERRADFPKLRINHVLSETNIDLFGEFLALVEKLSPDAIDVRTVVRMSNAQIQENHDAAFFQRIHETREQLAAFCLRTGIEDAGVLRWQPDLIDIFSPAGEKVTCRRPWDTLAIHANGDVHPCMSWTRPPVGNIARESFEEIWGGPGVEALRAEFEEVKPGIDCQHCTIKKNVSPELHDDFFYAMLAKQFDRDLTPGS